MKLFSRSDRNKRIEENHDALLEELLEQEPETTAEAETPVPEAPAETPVPEAPAETPESAPLPEEEPALPEYADSEYEESEYEEEPALEDYPEDEENPGGEKPQKRSRRERSQERGSRRLPLGLIAAVCVLVALAIGALALGIVITNGDTVLPNVSVEGVGVGGMTREQAQAALSEAGWDELEGDEVTVLLPLEQQVTVTSTEAGAQLTSVEGADLAYRYGRESSIFGNLFTYAKCLLSGAQLELTAQSVDEAVIGEKVDKIVSAVTEGLMTSGLEVTEDAIEVVKGASAVKIDAAQIKADMAEALRTGDYGEREYKAEIGEPVELDVDELYDSICREAADAYYDRETGDISPSERGVSFDKSTARTLWQNADYGDTVVIPITVTEPGLSTEDVEAMIFRDVLGSASTTLFGSSASRISNVSLAASIIDGTVLKPGETFSYNGVLGQRTSERGFKYAGAYSGGQVVQEIGGGICQLSSSIYYSALLSNLQIDLRTCHYFGVGYLPPGLDATVSWKTPDFKFTNNRDYPITIKASVNTEKNTLEVSILGTNVDGSYVEMTYAVWFVYGNAEYPDVATGTKAATYRWVYDANGNLLSKELEAYSEYHFHEEDIEYPSPSPSPSPSTSPSPSAPPSTEPTPPSTEPTPVTTPTPPPVESPPLPTVPVGP